MAQPTSFWDRIAEGYARRPVADEASYQRKLEVTRGYLRPDMAVLEFGCGTGTTAITHAPHVKSILATDISAKMLEIARGKAAAAGVENVTFQQSGIDDFAAPDGAFDIAMGHSILHLVEDKDAVIAKVYGMLKSGGAFVSSTACLADTQSYLKLVIPIMQFFGRAPTVKFFTRNELRSSLTAAGFAIDHEWQPGKGKAVFFVAKKAEQAA